MTADVVPISRRGGARPGAGRPFEGGPTTAPIRVPIKYADKKVFDELLALRQLVNDWECRSLDASKSSPRWEQMREFLSEARAATPLLSKDLPF